ncbi:rCG38890 [Rattus norvegicus]|uniref:RCG38890 n=1 Tax=Rattus norvegicus TaxID=10116 RepID=A6K9Q9_RAT|nr:rCG38890 [Rattus norvegicus]
MHFFLANLALVYVCFTSATSPKILANHVSGHKGNSYSGCLPQIFFIWFASIDSFLLTAMAYDRPLGGCLSPSTLYNVNDNSALLSSWSLHPAWVSQMPSHTQFSDLPLLLCSRLLL